MDSQSHSVCCWILGGVLFRISYKGVCHFSNSVPYPCMYFGHWNGHFSRFMDIILLWKISYNLWDQQVKTETLTAPKEAPFWRSTFVLLILRNTV